MVTMMSEMKLMQLLMLQNVEVDYYHIKLCADYLKVLIVFFLCCSIPKTSYFCGVKQSRYGGVRKIFKNMEKGRFYFCCNCGRRDVLNYCPFAPHGDAADDRDAHQCIESGDFILIE